MNLDSSTNAAERADLEALRRDFPRYKIDVEIAIDRRRYVALRSQFGPGPHTVITSDLAELRAELSQAAEPGASRQNIGR